MGLLAKELNGCHSFFAAWIKLYLYIPVLKWGWERSLCPSQQTSGWGLPAKLSVACSRNTLTQNKIKRTLLCFTPTEAGCVEAVLSCIQQALKQTMIFVVYYLNFPDFHTITATPDQQLLCLYGYTGLYNFIVFVIFIFSISFSKPKRRCWLYYLN